MLLLFCNSLGSLVVMCNISLFFFSFTDIKKLKRLIVFEISFNSLTSLPSRYAFILISRIDPIKYLFIINTFNSDFESCNSVSQSANLLGSQLVSQSLVLYQHTCNITCDTNWDTAQAHENMSHEHQRVHIYPRSLLLTFLQS